MLMITKLKIWVEGSPMAFVELRMVGIEDRPKQEVIGTTKSCLKFNAFLEGQKERCTSAKECAQGRKEMFAEYRDDICEEWSANSYANDCATEVMADPDFLDRVLSPVFCGKKEKTGGACFVVKAAKDCQRRCLRCIKEHHQTKEVILKAGGKDADGGSCSTCAICKGWRKCAGFLKRVVTKIAFKTKEKITKDLLDKFREEYEKSLSTSTEGNTKLEKVSQLVMAVVKEVVELVIKAEGTLSSDQKASMEAETCADIATNQNQDLAPPTCVLKDGRRRSLLESSYTMEVTFEESIGTDLNELQSSVEVVAQQNGATVESASSEMGDEVTLLTVTTSDDEESLDAVSTELEAITDSALVEFASSPDVVAANGGTELATDDFTTVQEIEAPPEVKSVADVYEEEEDGPDDDFSGVLESASLSAIALLFAALV
jgi:hypothetical protein